MAAINDKNLIPFSERTESERREIARKGGKASGKKRKEKKMIRDAIATVMSLPVIDDEMKTIMSLLNIPEEERTFHTAIGIAAAIGAEQGDLGKMNYVADMNGESLRALELEEKKRSNKANEKLRREELKNMRGEHKEKDKKKFSDIVEQMGKHVNNLEEYEDGNKTV